MKRSLLLYFFVFTFVFHQAHGQGRFLGMTSAGGDHTSGSIFKIDNEGKNPSLEFSFKSDFPGRTPVLGEMIQASNGKFYGVAQSGGLLDHGVLFEYDPYNTSYVAKWFFDGNNTGSHPTATLLEYSNGKLIGTTHDGGSNGFGVLYEFDIMLNSFSKKADFDGANGKYLYGKMAKGSNGKLYGTSFNGGATDAGVLFEYDPSSGALSNKFDFDAATGSNPPGGLFAASDGKLYGTTQSGGSNNKGVLFQYDPAFNIYSKKIDFNGFGNGRQPAGNLIELTGNRICGVTSYGGVNDKGVLFTYNSVTEILNNVYDFNDAFGYQPIGTPCIATDGNIYGTALYGGANGGGVLFEFNPNTNTYTTRVDFKNGRQGFLPNAGVIQASNGNLYGTTSYGGNSNYGVIFEFSPATKSYTKKVDFGSAVNGLEPTGNLTEGPDMKFFGMTIFGGVNSHGVLFEYDVSTKVFKKKIDFDGDSNGANPLGNLTLLNGKLYGLTSLGGTNNAGVLFEYDIGSSSISNATSFEWNVGAYPEGDLTIGPNGKLYGLTTAGGVNSHGTLFEFDPITKALVKKFDFDLATSGGYPDGALITVEGKLYGIASSGGANNMGTFFEFDPLLGTFNKKLNLDASVNGNYWTKTLTLHSNGNLYGTTMIGGANNFGVLFEIDIPNNTLSKKFDFDPNTTGSPRSLTFNPVNKKLYGMTSSGNGAISKGIVFTYDPTSGILSKTFSFDGYIGANPLGTLVFVRENQAITFNELTSKSFGNIPFQLQGTVSSGLPITYTSSNPAIASIHGNVVTILGAGQVSITASQAGNESYKPASSVTKTLTIDKSEQTITFNSLLNKTFGNQPFTLEATSTSNLVVLFVSSNTEIAAVSGSTVMIKKAGSVTIKALQVGNSNYLAAPEVEQVLLINKADQVITFSPIQTKTFGGNPFALQTTITSDLLVTYSAQKGKVSINQNIATVVSPGRETITATQTGNDNYTNASPVSQSFCVNPAKPVIISVINTNVTTLTSSSDSGNKWFKNGTAIEGAISKNFTPSETGVYSLRVSVDDCLSELSEEVLYVITGDIKQAPSIELFPNPVQNELFVLGEANDIVEVGIADAIGKQWHADFKRERDRVRVEVGNFPAGTYYLRLMKKSSSSVVRFIKE